jgi:hypothetical protein
VRRGIQIENVKISSSGLDIITSDPVPGSEPHHIPETVSLSISLGKIECLEGERNLGLGCKFSIFFVYEFRSWLTLSPTLTIKID